MTKKECLTCEEGNSEIVSTEKEIPEWMIKSNNPSLIPKQLLCKKNYDPEKIKVSEWKPKSPKITTKKIEKKIDTKITDNWILYWASSEKEDDKIKGAADAYGDYENSGLLKTDMNGFGNFIFNCPQGYKAEGEVWEPHIHFTVLKDEKYWDPVVRTFESGECEEESDEEEKDEESEEDEKDEESEEDEKDEESDEEEEDSDEEEEDEKYDIDEMKEEMIFIKKDKEIFKFRHEFSTNQLFYLDDNEKETFIGFWKNKYGESKIDWNDKKETNKIKEKYEGKKQEVDESEDSEEEKEEEEKEDKKKKNKKTKVKELKKILNGGDGSFDFSDHLTLMAGGGISKNFRGYGFTFF